MNDNTLFKINGFDRYYITKDGKVKSKNNKDWKRTHVCNGYVYTSLDRKKYAVHRLVAQTFIPNLENKPYVNHIDCNKLNNHMSNLEWVTQKENCSAHDKKTSHPKRVIQKDLQGNTIRTYNSIKDAGVGVGLSSSAISKVVLGINTTAGGYTWKYEESYTCELNTCKGKPIYGNTKYCIFSDGSVYNTVRKTKVKPIKNASGYCYVTICNNKSKKNYYVHRLVADHFIKNTDINKTQVNHKNKKRDDNHIDNLEWVTPSENMIHANSKVLSS